MTLKKFTAKNIQIELDRVILQRELGELRKKLALKERQLEKFEERVIA